MAQTTTTSFQSMINAEREKKKREDLAQRMLGSRRSSTGGAALPGRKATGGLGASLASRVGVTKTSQRSQSAAPKPNIEGQWTHDLHEVGGRRASRPSSTIAPSNDRHSRLAVGLQRELSGTNGTSSQANIRKAPTGPSMSIRGMATPQQTGPYVVIASNFAPGTTAADIEAAMAPIGGEIRSCRLVASNPTVMAELVFEDKDGAENVIATFNNQKADGRLLYVYLKAGGPTPGLHPLHSTPKAKTQPPASIKEVAQESVLPKDETMMDVDEDKAPRRDDRRRYDDRDRYRDYRGGGYTDGRSGFGGRPDGPRGYDRGQRGLYSDNMYRGDSYRR